MAVVGTKKAVDKQTTEQKDEQACVKYQTRNSQQVIGENNKYKKLVPTSRLGEGTSL